MKKQEVAKILQGSHGRFCMKIIVTMIPKNRNEKQELKVGDLVTKHISVFVYSESRFTSKHGTIKRTGIICKKILL